jgi:hypothetical protein
MIVRSCFLTLLTGTLLAVSAFAEEPRQVMWADLVPTSAAFDNPFLKLTPEQLARVSEVAAIRDRRARGDKNLSQAESTGEQALSRKLAQAGVDVDGLLAKRKEIVERGRAVNPLLNGQLVRLPGYLLPLEFSGKLVSEFLLVPWVGACIHTPPTGPHDGPIRAGLGNRAAQGGRAQQKPVARGRLRRHRSGVFDTREPGRTLQAIAGKPVATT